MRNVAAIIKGLASIGCLVLILIAIVGVILGFV